VADGNPAKADRRQSMEFLRALVLFLYAVVAVLATAIAGLLIGVYLIIAGCMAAVVGVVFTRPADLPERASVFTLPPDGEKAKPNYLYGPARSDLRYVRQVTLSRWQRSSASWRGRVGGMLDPGDTVLALTGPIGVGLAVGLTAAILIMAVVAGVALLATEVVLDLCTVSVRCAALTLRAVDSGLLHVRHIRVRCIACFEPIAYPAYLCPECKTPQWDIRPGRYGVLRRTCECGHSMPTLLILGTAKLDAICPRRGCRHPLDYRPGEVREIILPLFGPKRAGKTVLLWGIVKTLQGSAGPGVRVEYGNADTATWVGDLDAAIKAGLSRVPATTAPAPKAYVLRLQVGRYRRLLQLPDPAGELFYDSRLSADLLYLGAASTFILVIDPLSIDVFWQGLSAEWQKRLEDHRSAAPDPERIYQQTAERIMQMGKRSAQRRLAIVFSRADLVCGGYGPASAAEEDMRKWAQDDLGLGDLLRDAQSDFHEVTLFHTEPFSCDEHGLDTLVHWIMRAESVPYGSAGPGPGDPAKRLSCRSGAGQLALIADRGEVGQRPGPPVLG
jgi:hypothetical protein